MTGTTRLDRIGSRFTAIVIGVMQPLLMIVSVIAVAVLELFWLFFTSAADWLRRHRHRRAGDFADCGLLLRPVGHAEQPAAKDSPVIQRALRTRGPTRWPLLTLLALAIASLMACATRKPLAAGGDTLTLAHINGTQGRYLPVAVSPGNTTAQTGDPGRDEQSFSRVGAVGVVAAAFKRRGTVSAPQLGNITLITAPDS
ncbi:MAG: hypothetical protein ACSLE9_21470 [Burkholderiaceae bacterium]